MCDHCGCREVSPIERLTTEHEAMLDLSGEIRTALRDGRESAARAMFTQLMAILGPHAKAEENGLFSVMRHREDTYDDYLDRLEADHRRLHHGGATAISPDRMIAVLDDLSEHIRAENVGLFPAALATLSGDDWEVVRAAFEPPGDRVFTNRMG